MVRNFPIKILVRNRRAMKTNETLKELQVGLQLVPSEVKAMRENRCDLSAAFVDHYDNELFLHQAYVPVWRNGVLGKPDPYRPRKILARRREIDNWIEYLEQRDSQVVSSSTDHRGDIHFTMRCSFRKN